MSSPNASVASKKKMIRPSVLRQFEHLSVNTQHVSPQNSSSHFSNRPHSPTNASLPISAQNRLCSNNEEQRRLQSVRFLVNHAAQLSSDDPSLFQSSLQFVLDPLLGGGTCSQVCSPQPQSPSLNEGRECQSSLSSERQKNQLSCDSRNDESCTSFLNDQFSAARSGGNSCTTSTMADRFSGSRHAFGQSTVPGSFVPRHVFMHKGSCNESCDFFQGDVALGVGRRAQPEADHFGGKGHALGQSLAPLGCGGPIDPIAECMDDSSSICSVMSFDANEIDGFFERSCGDRCHDDSNKRDDFDLDENNENNGETKKSRSGPAPPRFQTIVGRDQFYSQGGAF
jgi:hypothetical protein